MSNFVKSLLKGVPTAESAEMLKRMGITHDINESKSANEIDLNSIVRENEKVNILSQSAREALLSGKGAKTIKETFGSNLFHDTGVKTTNQYLNKDKPPVNESPNQQSNSHSNVKSENIEDVVYEVLSDLLSISKSKMSDKEYIKDLFADAVAFIKIRETMKK